MRVFRTIRHPGGVFFATAALLLASGCGKGSGRVGRAIVLVVADASYSNAEFQTYVHNAAGNDKLSAIAESRLFDRFVEEKLLLEAARRQNLTLSDEDKRNYLVRWASGSPSGDSRDGEDETDKPGFFDGLLIEKYTTLLVKDVTVGDEEIHAYYENHKKDFLLHERNQVSQILLKTESKAVETLEKLKFASEEDFRRIAREESVGPEAVKGGSMGIFSLGDLPAEMEKAIFSLEEGKLSPILESSYGFHIFRVDRKFPPQLLPEEEAASSIRVKILENKVDETVSAHLDELRRSLAWKAYPENLSFAYQRNET
jgi:hypothetical protein